MQISIRTWINATKYRIPVNHEIFLFNIWQSRCKSIQSDIEYPGTKDLSNLQTLHFDQGMMGHVNNNMFSYKVQQVL